MKKLKNKMIENVRQNLRTLTEPHGEKQRLLWAARECRPTLDKVLKGQTNPSMNLFLTACSLYGISPERMLRGPIVAKVPDVMPEDVSGKVKTPTDREKYVARLVIEHGMSIKQAAAMIERSRQYVEHCVKRVKMWA